MKWLAGAGLLIGVAVAAALFFYWPALQKLALPGGKSNPVNVREAAEKGDREEQLHLGLLYREGLNVPQDYAEAARWFRKAAEGGDARAQVLLGLLYERGNGVPQDDSQALAWYRRAAEQGQPQGEVNLARFLFKGRGGAAVDREAAIALLRKAAARGEENAQRALQQIEGAAGQAR